MEVPGPPGEPLWEENGLWLPSQPPLSGHDAGERNGPPASSPRPDSADASPDRGLQIQDPSDHNRPWVSFPIRGGMLEVTGIWGIGGLGIRCP